MTNPTISDLYKENAEKLKIAQEQSILSTKVKVANRVREAYEAKREEIEALITKILISDGAVYLGGFGCLCNGGMCVDQDGYGEYLSDIEDYWKEKGIEISWHGISGITFLIEDIQYTGISRIINAYDLTVKWC